MADISKHADENAGDMIGVKGLPTPGASVGDFPTTFPTGSILTVVAWLRGNGDWKTALAAVYALIGYALGQFVSGTTPPPPVFSFGVGAAKALGGPDDHAVSQADALEALARQHDAHGGKLGFVFPQWLLPLLMQLLQKLLTQTTAA
jgi:hypothetical protein